MFKIKNNAEIGAYLCVQINKKFKNQRQFCKACLQARKESVTEESLQNFSNRISQIKSGNKRIQLDDLPIFCSLLGITCEQLLSAGHCFVPSDNRMTNYKVAFSKDKKVWTEYVQRKDKIILNTDEYGKTVIDYALEFKNYPFLKFLTDNKYIWFVDLDEKNHVTSFRAGTSIKRDPLKEYGMEYIIASEDKLRCQMITLAIENDDFDMLTSLRARETPNLYWCTWHYNPRYDEADKYYDEDMVLCISKASDKMLDYFAEEFTITSKIGRNNENTFIFPFIDKLLEILIRDNHKFTEFILRECIKHNTNTYNSLISLMKSAYEEDRKQFICEYSSEKDIQRANENAKAFIMKNFKLDDKNNMVYFINCWSKKGIASNTVSVNAQSSDPTIKHLLEMLNESYQKIANIGDEI